VAQAREAGRGYSSKIVTGHAGRCHNLWLFRLSKSWARRRRDRCGKVEGRRGKRPDPALEVVDQARGTAGLLPVGWKRQLGPHFHWCLWARERTK
jgi:hypothetical protein